jgi:outer membrane receptor protein involved in Fe transport
MLCNTRLALFAIPLVIILFSTLTLAGQSGPAVTGTVVDRSGGAVSGARVQLTDVRSQTTEVRTDAQGNFSLPAIEAPSRLRVDASGFAVRVLNLAVSAASQPLRIELEAGLLSDAITVTPGRTELRLIDAPASVTALSRVEIAAAAAQTFDDLLRQVPGFSIFRRSSSLVANPTTQGVSLRGTGATGASRTLVLNDGIPLNDAFGGWVYWSRLPRQAVEQIEVVRGGGSDLYGSDALSGVINVLSRKVNAPTIDAEGALGDRETSDFNFFAGQRWKRLEASVSGEAFRTGGYYLLDPRQRGVADDRAGSRHRLLSTRLTWHQSDETAVWVRGTLFDEDRRNGTKLQRNDTATESLAIGGRTRTSDGSAWNLAIFANQQRFNQSFTSVAANRATETLTRLQFIPARDAGFSINWSRTVLTRHTLVAGVDLRGVRGTSDEIVYTAGRPIRFDSSGGRQRRSGIFLQDLISLSARWQLSASARIDEWRDSSAASVQRSLASGAVTPRFFPTRRANAFSPRLAILYRPRPELNLRAAVYRAFRAPTLNELYREFRVGDALTRANENLTAERLTGGELGADWHLGGRTHLRLTGYLTEINNPIVNFTESVTPSLITRQRRNLGRTRSNGIEAEAEFRLTRDWRLTSGYLFAATSVLAAPQDPTLVGRAIPQVPRHQFTWQTIYSRPGVITAALQFRAAGRQFDDDRNFFPLDRLAIFDAHIARPLGRYIELFVAAQNLFDQRYIVARTPIETYGMPRLWRGGLRIRLKD